MPSPNHLPALLLLLLLLCYHAGGTSKPPKLDIQVTATTLTLQHQGFAPVLSRCWSHPVDSSQGVTSWVSADGQLVCLVTSKAQPGMAWNTCFKVGVPLSPASTGAAASLPVRQRKSAGGWGSEGGQLSCLVTPKA